VPTFIAMFIVGAWHGGNWTFMVFGPQKRIKNGRKRGGSRRERGV